MNDFLSRSRFGYWLLALVTVSALSSCANEERDFTFAFGNFYEDAGVDILDYQFGTSKTLPVHPPDWTKEAGKVPQQGAVYAHFPPGDILYVKWRNLKSNTVFEKTVDLHSRLPSNMRDKTVYFIIRDDDLFVYLISNNPHDLAPGTCPLHAYSTHKCTLVSP